VHTYLLKNWYALDTAISHQSISLFCLVHILSAGPVSEQQLRGHGLEECQTLLLSNWHPLASRSHCYRTPVSRQIGRSGRAIYLIPTYKIFMLTILLSDLCRRGESQRNHVSSIGVGSPWSNANWTEPFTPKPSQP